jgi:regulator of RNase E activity RraA
MSGSDGMLGSASAALVSDALDRLGIRDHTLGPEIGPISGHGFLTGRAVPVVVIASDRMPDEPYAGDIRLLESLEPGEVPVFAAGPAVQAALWGELFSCAALAREAGGAVVDGYVRDVPQLRQLPFPVFARGASPLDTLGRAEVVDLRVTVEIGGVAVAPGDLVVGDDDGLVVVPAAAVAEVAALVEAKARDELGARADLENGAGLRAVWERWGAL